ncbi:hypothetical protein AX774_g6775 [Zancudomyces culisetae]|uniref:RGS domain-containing protein n=1 Tax=Zancudomyces culisetae TaxID=1213189 RepID=A0A1R1PFP4_ZANCU|nr:hypothetical protein AX774_g6775 [Zancudomyces culisetae]|eukprot:OMH79804.1 hypothetical protein AX774_g6775 [Zancudomyces culisetae]
MSSISIKFLTSCLILLNNILLVDSAWHCGSSQLDKRQLQQAQHLQRSSNNNNSNYNSNNDIQVSDAEYERLVSQYHSQFTTKAIVWAVILFLYTVFILVSVYFYFRKTRKLPTFRFDSAPLLLLVVITSYIQVIYTVFQEIFIVVFPCYLRLWIAVPTFVLFTTALLFRLIRFALKVRSMHYKNVISDIFAILEHDPNARTHIISTYFLNDPNNTKTTKNNSNSNSNNNRRNPNSNTQHIPNDSNSNLNFNFNSPTSKSQPQSQSRPASHHPVVAQFDQISFFSRFFRFLTDKRICSSTVENAKDEFIYRLNTTNKLLRMIKTRNYLVALAIYTVIIMGISIILLKTSAYTFGASNFFCPLKIDWSIVPFIATIFITVFLLLQLVYSYRHFRDAYGVFAEMVASLVIMVVFYSSQIAYNHYISYNVALLMTGHVLTLPIYFIQHYFMVVVPTLKASQIDRLRSSSESFTAISTAYNDPNSNSNPNFDSNATAKDHAQSGTFGSIKHVFTSFLAHLFSSGSNFSSSKSQPTQTTLCGSKVQETTSPLPTNKNIHQNKTDTSLFNKSKSNANRHTISNSNNNTSTTFKNNPKKDRYKSFINNQLSNKFPHTSKSKSNKHKSNSNALTNSSRREQFESLLAYPAGIVRLEKAANETFCPENVVFLKDYQLLKYRVCSIIIDQTSKRENGDENDDEYDDDDSDNNSYRGSRSHNSSRNNSRNNSNNNSNNNSHTDIGENTSNLGGNISTIQAANSSLPLNSLDLTISTPPFISTSLPTPSPAQNQTTFTGITNTNTNTTSTTTTTNTSPNQKAPSNLPKNNTSQQHEKSELYNDNSNSNSSNINNNVDSQLKHKHQQLLLSSQTAVTKTTPTTALPVFQKRNELGLLVSPLSSITSSAAPSTPSTPSAPASVFTTNTSAADDAPDIPDFEALIAGDLVHPLPLTIPETVYRMGLMLELYILNEADGISEKQSPRLSPVPKLLVREYISFYRKFIMQNAPLAVNIPIRTINPIVERIEAGKFTLGMFDDAFKEVLNNLYNNTYYVMLKTL